MNTQHLQYIIEIERTRSISQAAENLFLGQPNLSRILHDMEQSLGFRIFERTSRGVRPTERGAKFLKHARNMLREMDYIEALGPRNAVPNRLRVCIPRSTRLFEATSEYIASLNPERDLDARILECHARRALEILSSGEAEIGVIRFRAEYRDYFEEQTVQRELSLQILSKYRYMLILPQSHPLAERPAIRMSELEGFAEIVHGDNLRAHGRQQNVACRKIYTVDRMAQLTREAIFDAIALVDGGEYTAEKAERIEALETKIDRYEDKLGTYMVKLSRAKLSQKDGHTLSLLLHSISDFERISDHAVNLLDSVKEMNEKKMSFSPAAAGELHVFSLAVRDIIERSFDSFLRDDVELAKTVEPLEACIDDINVNIKSRHIERLTTGQCTIELGFVLTDISTNFERVSDHCSNIAVYEIQVPKDEYDAHEYLQNVKHQEHAEFDREEMAYEKRYRLPDIIRTAGAEE
mgnify:CR=1 FL=1